MYTVAAKRGIVMMSGKAGNAVKKDPMTKLVKDINGVKNVKNPMTTGQWC